MTISFKKWVAWVLGAVFAAMALVVLINFIVDPYGIWRTNFSRQFQEPNQNYVKMKYVLEHRDRFDSFLFGSSRALQIDTRKIAGGRFYNMGFSEGVPEEHLENLRLLLRSGVHVKNVIIALDDFSWRIDPEIHHQQLLRQPHYLISGKSRIAFYGQYLLNSYRLNRTIRNYVRHNYTRRGTPQEMRTFYDTFGSGRVICTTCDSEIESDVAKYVSDPRFNKPYLVGGNNMDRALDSMRVVVRLCHENDITLTVLINPVHRVTYLSSGLEGFFRFKKELASITDYYDFSGLNSITTNNYYYHETSHFREVVGDMMLTVMFGAPRAAVPAGFGAFVTAATVDAHLEKQQDELRDIPESERTRPETLAPLPPTFDQKDADR
jgi:hypothetical protein